MQNRLKGSQLKLSLNCFLIDFWSKVASICCEAPCRERVGKGDLKKVIEGQGQRLLKGNIEPHKMKVMIFSPITVLPEKEYNRYQK